jgi:hypothetical protein
MSLSFGSALIAASVTGFGSGSTAPVVTATQGSSFLAVGKSLAEDFADADDLLLVAGVIEEKFFALLHRLKMFARREIAHATPRLALLAALDLIVPGKLFRLGLHQPIRHRHSSAFVSLSPFTGRG